MNPEFLTQNIFGIKQKRLAIHESYYIKNEQNQDIMFATRKLHFWRSLGSGLLFLLGILSAAGLFLVILMILMGATDSDKLFEMIVGGVMCIALSALFFWLWFKATPLRHIYFYESEEVAKTNPANFIFEIQQGEKVEFLHSKFYLRDKEGNLIFSMIKNVFRDALLQKHWHITIGNTTFEAKEDSLPLAIMRRFVQAANLIPMTFYFYHPVDKNRAIGAFRRKFELFDNYKLDMTSDPDFLMNRACAIGIAVLLDTGEKR